MPHTPWPENGCTLAEARERTADRVGWKEWNDRIARYSSRDIQKLTRLHEGSRSEQLKQTINECEDKINSDFVLQMSARQLIAYGRPRERSGPRQLITADTWSALTAIGWEQSTAENRRGGALFRGVRVYPALLSPCRVDLVLGLSLIVAFKKFVLEDPEFVALARQAAKFDKATHPMLIEGQFPRDINFDWQWPIVPFANFADVLNDAQTLYQGGPSSARSLAMPAKFSAIATSVS